MSLLAVTVGDFEVQDVTTDRQTPVHIKACGDSILEISERDFDHLMCALIRFQEMRLTRNMQVRSE